MLPHPQHLAPQSAHGIVIPVRAAGRPHYERTVSTAVNGTVYTSPRPYERIISHAIVGPD